MTFWRINLDLLADRIDQLEDADPDSDLARRLFRAGKSDGRRRREYGGVRSFLIEAVDLAASRIAQQYLQEAQELELRVAQVESQLGSSKDDDRYDNGVGQASSDAGEPAGDVTPLRAAGPQHGDDHSGGMPSPRADHGELLAGSLRRLRADKDERRRQQQRAEMDKRRGERASLEASLRTAAKRLEELPGPYVQRIECVHEFGRLLWARYCAGFEHGKNKRGRPEDEHPGPVSEIRFEVPAVLADKRPAGESGLHARAT